MAHRHFEWVNLNRIFVASLRLCGEPLFSDPTTETRRHREQKKEMGIVLPEKGKKTLSLCSSVVPSVC